MPTLEEFIDAMDEWDRCAAQGEIAYEERDYRAFQTAFRKAERSFGIIRRAIIEKRHEETVQDHSTRLAKIAGRWDELATEMQTWKVELKDSYEKARKQISKGKRIKKGYGPKGQTGGNNLRLRAT